MLAKAIIPAAGRGTRVAELSGERSKECLEVAGFPMIAWTLLELALAGLPEVCVVVAPRKTDLIELLRNLPAFPTDERVARIHPGSAHEGRREWPRVVLAEQLDPRGVVDALSRGADYLEGEPFLLTMPDNFFAGARSPAAAVAELHGETGRPVMGLREIGREEASRLGNVGGVDVDVDGRGVGAVRRVHPKRPGTFQVPDGAETVLRAVGRTLVPAAFADVSPEEAPGPGAELDDVPRFQALAAGGELLGVRLDAELHDLGQAEGLRRARALLEESR